MDPKIKADWVAALRSGKYKQGKGVLRDEEGCYCCLGVLNQLARDVGVRAQWKSNGVPLEYPSASVVLWAGLKSNNPRVEIDGYSARLVDLNDGNEEGEAEPRTFAEIADLIEAQL